MIKFADNSKRKLPNVIEMQRLNEEMKAKLVARVTGKVVEIVCEEPPIKIEPPIKPVSDATGFSD